MRGYVTTAANEIAVSGERGRVAVRLCIGARLVSPISVSQVAPCQSVAEPTLCFMPRGGLAGELVFIKVLVFGISGCGAMQAKGTTETGLGVSA